MDMTAFILGSMDRARSYTLRSIEGVTEAEYTWRAGPDANPIAWLLLHIGRTEDNSFHRLIRPGGPQIWVSEGFDKTYALSVDDVPRSVGTGWTSEDVARFAYPPLDEMLSYLEKVQASAVSIIREIDPARLDDVLQPDRPGATLGAALWGQPQHESSHRGAIEFIRGLYTSVRRS